MFTCDLYAGVVPQMSPQPHDLERLRTTMVDFIVIFNRGRSVVDFVRVAYFIPLNGPLNGHPPSTTSTLLSNNYNINIHTYHTITNRGKLLIFPIYLLLLFYITVPCTGAPSTASCDFRVLKLKIIQVSRRQHDRAILGVNDT